ncbi:MAG: polysaccharide biosynthesis protein [Acidobacteria bacterium]|nr:MAG: polysaccharide biosynthesis protein [Acidobacteriota bacterium]
MKESTAHIGASTGRAEARRVTGDAALHRQVAPFRIPMSSPDITQAEVDAVNAVLRTPHLSIGPCVDEFERRVADYAGARHAVAVSSGTAGLHLAVIAVGVTDGDEVITTPFSFVASANVALYERARPVFVDVDPESLNIDANRIESAITPRTKAILPVHAFGQPADMDAILDIARRHKLIVIEDACEAIGAEYKGRKAGALGHAGVFAFYPNKQMTTGEGGVIVTGDDNWNHLFRSLRNQGRDVFDAWLNHSRLGYNYRLDEMSAALGLAQINRIEALLAKRERVAGWYAARLQKIEGVTVQFVAATPTRASWFVYVVRLAPHIQRDQIVRRLDERGIPCRPYFQPIHLQPFYRQRFGCMPGDFPVTERVAASTLAVPFFGNMSEEQVNAVCDALREVLDEAAAGKSMNETTDEHR